MIVEDLAAARSELRRRDSKQHIEAETASKWGARAVAAMERFNETEDGVFYIDAIDYAHEAVEHAAFAGDGVLEEVRRILARYRVPV